MKNWGAARTGLFLVGLLLALGALRSWRRVELDPVSGAPAIIDADSVWRLRRIGLAIETGRLAQSDSFLSFPGSADSVDLPLYDELLAIGFRVLSGGAVGAPGEGLDEDLLMSKALRVGPIIGLLFLLALHRSWTRWFGLSNGVACLATLWAASLPLFMDQSHAGVLSIELFASLVALAAGGLLIHTLRCRAVLDRFTFAMVAGAACGAGLITSPLFLLFLFAAWCAFLFEAMTAEGEGRIEWVRAFLLFLITCALVSILPSLGGPWVPSQSGSIKGWTQLCSNLMLLAASPSLLMMWTPRKPWSVNIRRLLPPVVLLLGGLAVALARAFGPEHSDFALLFANLRWSSASTLDVSWSANRGALLVLGLIGGVELMRVRREAWTGPGVLLCLWGVSSWLLGIFFEPLGIFCVPVVLGVAGRAMGGLPNRKLAFAGLVVCLCLSASDAVDRHHSPDEEGLAAMAAARSLRERTAPSGSYNTVFAVHRWGVLADERCAPLVAWYGRRPCASLGPARNGNLDGASALRGALSESSVPALEIRLWEMGLRWSLMGPATAQRWTAQGADSALMTGFLGEVGEGTVLELRELAQP